MPHIHLHSFLQGVIMDPFAKRHVTSFHGVPLGGIG